MGRGSQPLEGLLRGGRRNFGVALKKPVAGEKVGGAYIKNGVAPT
jgi:hypothetical protein